MKNSSAELQGVDIHAFYRCKVSDLRKVSLIRWSNSFVVWNMKTTKLNLMFLLEATTQLQFNYDKLEKHMSN